MVEKLKKKRLIKRIVVITFIALASLFVISAIVLSYYKDEIAKTLLLKANNAQQGELTFNEVLFNPFIHFPKISLELSSAAYFEQKQSDGRDSMQIPIIKLKSIYLAFDVIDLLKRNVNVSKIHLAHGEVNLIAYADSSFNFTNALRANDTLGVSDTSTIDRKTPFDLNINGLNLDDIAITYTKEADGVHSIYQIQNLDATFNYLPEKIKTSLNADILLEKLQLSEDLRLNDKQVNLITTLEYNRISEELQIEPSQLKFEKASFKTEGSVELKKNGLIDIKLKGDDRNFSMLELVFSANGLKNITNGNLYFDGTIKGDFSNGIPLMQCTFGMADVTVVIPNTKQKIEDLALSGSFSSGEKEDFSSATISLKNIKAVLPDGELNGDISFKDFTNPEFKLDIYLKSNIAGFENILDLGNLDSLSGIFELKTNFSGLYNMTQKRFVENTGESTLRFDSVSLTIPDVTTLNNIYGRIAFNDDSLCFQDLSLDFGNSDFNINGKLQNVLSLLTGSDDTIYGNLHIKSKLYDFPDFFKWDQNTATAFPYLIRDVNLFVSPTTTAAQLTNFISSPYVDFDIDHLDAEIEGFLPPVTIQSGLFVLGDKDSSLYLDFKDFNIELARSKLLVNMIYESPQNDPDWFNIKLDATDLSPDKVLYEWFDDTVPEFLNGMLNGQFDLEMVMSNDSLINFDRLDLKAHTLDYINTTDTFDIYQMDILTKNISYDLEGSTNFLEKLSFEMKLIADTVSTNYFKVGKVDDDIIAEEGKFHIIPNNSQFFDKKAKGDILLKPFDDPPSYRFSYAVDQFDVAALFNTFLEDTILTGKMDIDLELLFAGEGWDEVKENLNGKIDLYGKDLTLFGLDLDKVIDRFERSQRFTLADVGAILLMGPAGIVVTKGTDYARILVMNPGESSYMKEFSSKWEITNGIVNLKDVAFSTNQNRLAAIGEINIPADTLIVNLALINEEGCVEFGSSLTGTLKDPETGKLKLVKSMIAPVTNLVKSASGSDCEVFYNGRVKQPEGK